MFFVGKKGSAGFDFPDYDKITTMISSGSLIEDISSQNPTRRQADLHEDFDRLTEKNKEFRDASEEFLSS